MSSSEITASQIFTAQEIILYASMAILITGVIGGLSKIIVFLSLKTLRQNSCAFYLTIMSFVNLGQLLTGLLSRIMISGFSIDWTQMSLFYCKFRYFVFQTCTLLSFTCICPRWQQWSNIKISHRFIFFMDFTWNSIFNLL